MMLRLVDLWKRRRAIIVFCALIAASAAVYGLVHYSTKAPTVPTFQVKRGEFLDALEFRGQLKAMKSVTIAAPSNAGDLQILKIAADGTQVKKGDSVVEFDPSKTQQDLAQDQSALKTAEAEIEQARAEARLNEEVDTTAVMKAKYDVEMAKLDASKGEVVSRIEGAEANLKVADAEQALHEAEEKLKSDGAVDKPRRSRIETRQPQSRIRCAPCRRRTGCDDFEGAIGRSDQPPVDLAQRRRSSFQGGRTGVAWLADCRATRRRFAADCSARG